MSELEQHHIRYEELHGEDEIILLTSEEHKKVHREDKANGFKPIPKWISNAAHERSPAGKEQRNKYWKSEQGKATIARHQRTEARKMSSKRHDQTEKGKATIARAGAKYRAKLKEAAQ